MRDRRNNIERRSIYDRRILFYDLYSPERRKRPERRCGKDRREQVESLWSMNRKLKNSPQLGKPNLIVHEKAYTSSCLGLSQR
jgi:hypothetical protein